MDFNNEAFHVDHHCKGQIEYRLPDRSRVDCLTEEYAIEYDWSHKWAECIGQALHYAVQTNRKPACVLIVKNKDGDNRYILRYESATRFTNVELFLMDAIPKVSE